MDIEKLQKSLKLKYPEKLKIDANKYIDKIVQLQFELPPIDVDDMKKFIGDIAPPGFKKEEYIDVITQGINLNPRTIKLFLNTIRFQLALSEYRGFEIKKSLLIEWLVLKKSYPEFATEIEDNPVVLVQYHSKDILEKYKKCKSKKAKENFFSDNPLLKGRFLDNGKLIKVLNANTESFIESDVRHVIFQTTLTAPSIQKLKSKISILREISEHDTGVNYYPVMKVARYPSSIMGNEKVHVAEDQMKKEKTDFLVIRDSKELFQGIFTRADFNKARMDGKIEHKVRNTGTSREKVVVVYDGETLGMVMEIMLDSNYFRLPVLNYNKEAIGIVDADDIIFSSLIL